MVLWDNCLRRTCPAEPRLPGIASSLHTEVGIPTSLSHRGRDSDFALPPRSELRLRSPTEVGIPTSLSHRGRNSDFALPPRSELRLRFFAEKPITEPAPKVREICCPRSITPGVFFPSPGQRRRSVSEAVLAASLTECFFTTHTLPSILAWQQDCPCQSWRGNRIALVNPGVATGLPRCITSSSGLELFFPERRLVMESAPL